MKKNILFYISLLLMFFMMFFNFPDWFVTVLGLHMWVNIIWTIVLIFKK